MTYQDLPCRDFVELANDYLEGALGTEQRLVVELHLVFCEKCVDYLDQMRTTVATAGRLHEGEIPEPVMHSLVRAFRAIRSTSG